nr:MAG TPA_asm: hypothetical protein [Caudoviricetes sp.]
MLFTPRQVRLLSPRLLENVLRDTYCERCKKPSSCGWLGLYPPRLERVGKLYGIGQCERVRSLCHRKRIRTSYDFGSRPSHYAVSGKPGMRTCRG